MGYKIFFDDCFFDQLKKFPVKQQQLILKKIKLLVNDPGHSSLRTKKLNGYNDTYESSVNMGVRLIWELDGNKIIVNDVGRHDILKRYG